MGKIILISGTDTSVGKTYFSVLLLKYLKAKGKSVFALKPVESGCEGLPEDASRLAEVVDVPVSEVNFYSLKEPFLLSLAVRGDY